MKKRTKARRAKVSLKEKRQKSSRAWRHLMTRVSGAGQEGTESPDWAKRMDPRPAFRYLSEDDKEEQASGGLNHLVARNAAGAQWTWEKVTVAVDWGAAENVMPRSLFPEISTEKAERSKNGKGFEGPGGEHIKNYGQQVVSVRTPEGFVRQSTWQVAYVRRPPVSAFTSTSSTGEGQSQREKYNQRILLKERLARTIVSSRKGVSAIS